jgi:EmrB/QacA subfamily drug resistance transporter
MRCETSGKIPATARRAGDAGHRLMGAPIYATCDAAMARAGPPAGHGIAARLVLVTCILASSLAFVDGSVVNVGLPAIGRALRADASALQWVVNAYLMPLSALLLIGGAAGDRFGRRGLLILGTTLFGAASLACAMAPSLPLLLAGRGFQGLGAAMLMPNSLAILGATFSGEAKGRAIGIWAATGAAMGALGPVLGGWLIDTVGWRAIFFINLPLALSVVFLAWRCVPRDIPEPGRPLDIWGGVLATLGLAAATWALTVGSGPAGWTPAAIVAAAGAAALMAGFLGLERRMGEAAMTPLTLFVSRTFVGLTLLTLLLYGALGGLLVLLPFVLIRAAGYSATQAGAALLPLPLVLSILSPAMGAFAGRFGPRLPLALGPVVVAFGFTLLSRIDVTAVYWTQVFPALLVIAVGMSGAVAPLTTAILSSVDNRHTGSASGLNSAVARTGGLVATALIGSVLAASGAELLASFHIAALAAAAACLLAALLAFWLVGRVTV